MSLQKKMTSTFLMFVFLVTLMSGGNTEVFALGFQVQPSKLSFQIYPGKTAVTTITIQNTQFEDSLDLKLSVLNLTQGHNGIPEFSDVQVFTDTLSSLSHSCTSWIILPDSTLHLGTREKQDLKVRFKIPSSAQGTFYGGIGVQSVSNSNTGNIVLSVRLAISIEIQIKGPPSRKQVVISNPTLSYAPKTPKYSAKENISVTISNSGNSPSMVSGQAFLFTQSKKQNRRVMSVDFKEIKSIPGSSFDIIVPLPRRLPSGPYRLDFRGLIDGRPQSVLKQEINFIGDPSISKLTPDAEIILSQSTIEIQGIQGARRKSYLVIENSSDKPLKFKCSIVQPPSLIGVAMGSITGDEISGQDWTAVKPNNFIIKGGRKKRIAINAYFPSGDNIKTAYFSNLDVRAFYEDGQLAGSANAQIANINTKGQAISKLELSRVSLVKETSNEYALISDIENLGNIHLFGNCKYVISSMVNSQKVLELSAPSDNQAILPFEKRRFIGRFDLDKIPNGQYLLQVNVFFEGGFSEKEILLSISGNGNSRIASLSN